MVRVGRQTDPTWGGYGSLPANESPLLGRRRLPSTWLVSLFLLLPPRTPTMWQALS